MIVMQQGSVRESGTCERIMTDPQDPYTQQLIADSRLTEGPL